MSLQDLLLVFAVSLSLFVPITAGLAGLVWGFEEGRSRVESRPPAAVRAASTGVGLAIVVASQLLVVLALVHPVYGPQRFLLLLEPAVAGAWLLHLRRVSAALP